MSDDPRERSDFSRFIVHLTRKVQGVGAENNLINILKTKNIEARNYHCLFGPKLNKMKLTPLLKKSFKTVCFTETPLDQIHKMTSETYPRKIRLRPYGLVFWRHQLIKRGANPAIYVNGEGTNLRDYLISEFDRHFKGVKALKGLSRREAFYQEIVHYYSLVNVIAKNYDFSWEREWRFNGNFEFNYNKVVAIVAEDPDNFEDKCKKNLPKPKYNYVKKIPIISTFWSYEEVIEELSIKLWNIKA